MEIIKGLDAIREFQSVPSLPRSYDIKLRFPGYTKGWVVAQYNRRLEKWEYSYLESREEAVAYYNEFYELCASLPDVFNWFEYSEMYVYSSHRYVNAKWSLNFVMTA